VAPWLWGRLVGDTAAEEEEQIADCGIRYRRDGLYVWAGLRFFLERP
jgi:hypothetical protein